MTGRVELMDMMFYEADTFNQEISSWSTCRVTSMRYMFASACHFLHCQGASSVSAWCRHSLLDDLEMFNESGCESNISCISATTAVPTDCVMLIEQVPEACLQAESQPDIATCEDMVAAAKVDEESSQCHKGCKSVHSLKNMVQTLYDLNLADTVVCYIAFFLILVYVACILKNEKVLRETKSGTS